MLKLFALAAVLLTAIASAQTNSPQFSAEQKEVWAQEQKQFQYLQARDLKNYMSLWDDRFIGWPDYETRPAHKSDIEAAVKKEFADEPKLAHPYPTPQPVAVEVFGDVAITHYFWPDADPHPASKFRITHTWQRSASGWHIIAGMSCEVPAHPEATQSK